MTRFLLFSFLLFSWSACLHNGDVSIQKSISHDEKALKINKIVTIDPLYIVSDLRKTEGNTYLESDLKEKELNKTLLSNAKKCKIDLIVEDVDALESADIDYFNQLLPLKNQLFNANFTQEADINSDWNVKKGRATWFLPDVEYWKNPPQIGSDFSTLSKKYDTPYFALHGVFNIVYPPKVRWGQIIFVFPLGVYNSFRPRRESFYFTIVVDVETGETIYREYRSFRQKINNSTLNAILYDSFSVLKKSRK